MRWLVLAMLAACGGGYEIVPLERNAGCPTFACPIVAGGEALAYPAFYSDGGPEVVHAVSVTLTPPELADVRVADDVISIRPLASGGALPTDLATSGILNVILDKGSFEYRIQVASSAQTIVQLLPYQLDVPLEQAALYQGSWIDVVAGHRDASGQPLLGHGLETWTVEGGELREVPALDAWDDPSLVRALYATEVGRVRVSAGGTPLELDVLPAGSTARVALSTAGHELAADEPIHVPLGSYAFGHIVAYAADGRFLVGLPQTVEHGLSLSISDESIVSVEIGAAQQRGVSLFGYARGHANLVVELDGVRREIAVDVQ